MPRYLKLSTGGGVLERSRIAEASQKRIMREEARLQEETEERQYKRALEQQERQREFAAEERERQRIVAERAKQAEQESYLRNLELTGEKYGMGTTETRTGGYRPTTGRIQSEQVYRTMPTSEKMKYLRESVPITGPSQEKAKLREDIEAYGGDVPTGEKSEAYLEKLRDITKGEATQLEKERKEKAASHRKAVDMIKFTESRVVDPEVDNVMFRGDPDKEYTLDTFTEAKREVEARLKRPLSPEEEKMLRQIPYPEDGEDEYEEKLKREAAQAEKAGYVKIGDEYKRKITVTQKPIKTVIKGNNVFTENLETGELTKIQTIDTKDPKYLFDIQKATTAINNLPTEERKKAVFTDLVSQYPEKSSEIIRIIWPQKANQLLDIIQSLVEE